MGIVSKFSAIASALALVSTSSIAAVAPIAVSTPAPVNPFAIIGLYGSPASAQALCGNAASAVAAGAAAAAQAPGAGCVLPVADPVVVPPPAEPVAPIQTPVAATGPGIAPLLLGLAGIAGIAALIASQNGNKDRPVPPPISPA